MPSGFKNYHILADLHTDLTLRQIGDKYGISHQAVHCTLKRAIKAGYQFPHRQCWGFHKPSTRHAPQMSLTQKRERQRQIAQACQNQPASIVAEQFGVSRSHVSNCLTGKYHG